MISQDLERIASKAGRWDGLREILTAFPEDMIEKMTAKEMLGYILNLMREDYI